MNQHFGEEKNDLIHFLDYDLFFLSMYTYFIEMSIILYTFSDFTVAENATTNVQSLS